jgi:hypothetical protein
MPLKTPNSLENINQKIKEIKVECKEQKFKTPANASNAESPQMRRVRKEVEKCKYPDKIHAENSINMQFCKSCFRYRWNLFQRTLSFALGSSVPLADLLELHVQLLEARLQTRTLTEIEGFDGAAGLMHGCEGGAADGGGGVLEEAAGKGGGSWLGERRSQAGRFKDGGG